MKIGGMWIAGAALLGIVAVVILTRRPAVPGVMVGGAAMPGAPMYAPAYAAQAAGNGEAANVATWAGVGLGVLSGFKDLFN